MLERWIEFFREVRYEAGKVTWPSRKETLVTSLMVFIMSGIMAIFFFVIDTGVRLTVQSILGL